ncbi:DUF2271 domain-containing protein [Brevundimonas subvibrioides]|uniref:DUF2271 domain-containing protein n=1 Tax=Brevundimonas subvibrioides (strain ATCC 15264 / DSM 4735 / LMG 14903 / NBRC 16000 / CB 81) TaxID=633149 RepID=D9QP03_BRESC|nr:DUF2271 domain-containing protein [Brevundimonas subvibrioides]ADL00436.1 conserved hypothetical protein [Brevundimonas subvibrioides ATCC 15264]
MRTLPVVLAVAAGSVAAPALAADLTVTVEVPTVRTAAYHRPYVAIWIEQPDQTAVRTIALWYEAGETARGDGDGAQYLKDIRTWWRKGGRAMTVPISGVSGPTRAPGRQTVTVPGARLASLPAGQYNVVVEAAREQGGRELVRVPFTWGGAASSGSAAGTSELGAVRVAVTR